MKKAYLTLLLFGINPLYSMDVMALLQAAVKSCDYSKQQDQRGSIGGALRYLLKQCGVLNTDLIGLGSPAERQQTVQILNDLANNPGDKQLQKQYTDRQAIASVFACDLIARLEECCRNSTLEIVKESAGLLNLIQISVELRKLHMDSTLAPEYGVRLTKATNNARNRLKEKLGLTDSGDGTRDLLQEEPELNETTMQLAINTAPPETILARTKRILEQALARAQSSGGGAAGAARAALDSKYLELAMGIDSDFLDLAMQCASDELIVHHAQRVAQKQNKQLQLIPKDSTDS